MNRASIYLSLLGLTLWACERIEVDNRESESNSATEVSDPSLDQSGVSPDLSEFNIAINLRANANILSWQEVDAERFDLQVVEGYGQDFGQAQIVENVKSPYTHLKDPEQPFSYRLIAKKDKGDSFSQIVTDEPIGDLLACLQATEATKVTLEAIFSSSQIRDCYLYIDLPESLTQLNLTGKGITDLTPLSRFSQLEVLGLASNEITDLTTLIGLEKIKMLDLSSNPTLNDLSPITTLSNLESINISETGVSDLGFLNEIPNLESLTMDNLPELSNLAPVANLSKLQFLRAEGLTVVRDENTCPMVSVSGPLYRYCSQGSVITFETHIQKMLQLNCLNCHTQAAIVGTYELTNLSNQMIEAGTMPKAAPLSAGDKAIFNEYFLSLPPPVAEDEE